MIIESFADLCSDSANLFAKKPSGQKQQEKPSTVSLAITPVYSQEFASTYICLLGEDQHVVFTFFSLLHTFAHSLTPSLPPSLPR